MNILAIAAVLVFTLAGSACTTFVSEEAAPEELHRQLLSEELLRPGDRVRLVTKDETVHEFRITEVDLEQGVLIGREERVTIVDVIAVEKREASWGKTALLVGGVGYPLIVLVLIAAAPALILGGA